MKLASRPQLRHLLPSRGLIDRTIITGNSDNDMPPSFADVSSASMKKSSHRSSKKSKKKEKEKSTHKRLHTTTSGSSSSDSSPQQHNPRSSQHSTSLPTIFAENRESLTVDLNGDPLPHQNQIDDSSGSGNSSHPEIVDEKDHNLGNHSPTNSKMPVDMTETEKAQNRRRSQEQDAFVPAQLSVVKSSKNSRNNKNHNKGKKNSSSSSMLLPSGLRKSSKKKSTISNKTSSTITATASEAEWDDLGDEIASAMHNSLGIGAPPASTTTTGSSRKNKKSPMDDSDLPPWKCPACTYKNEPLHLVCGVCGTAAVALTTSIASSSSTNGGGGRAGSYLSQSQSHLSASYMSTNNNSTIFPSVTSNHNGMHLHASQRYNNGSSDNLAGSIHNQDFRRSTMTLETYNTNGYPPQIDPHNHRRMNTSSSSNNNNNNSNRRQYSDDNMSNEDSEGIPSSSYNIQDQVDFQEQRRLSRENDSSQSYYDNHHHHHHTNNEYHPPPPPVRTSSRGEYSRGEYSRGEYRGSRRLTYEEGGRDDYYNSSSRDRGRNLRRSTHTLEDDRPSRQHRGFSQSMQISSSSGLGGGSVASGRHHSRSRRRNDFYDDDSLSDRRSRASRDEGHYHRSSKEHHFRKSTMMDMDYDRGDRRGGGYRDDRERRSGSMSRYRGSGGGRNRYDDYSDASESFGTKGRITGGQYYDDGSIVSEMSDDEATFAERTVRTMQTIKKMAIPSGEVTIIYTDVQGSTALWEADPMSMKKATDIHDSIIRRCYSDHGGYEITTEGDAFNLAFQHPADAIGFALKAQLALYRAKWPEGTLGHPDGCDNEKKKFRGFRVRFGMHHGPTTSTVHKTTGRTTYQGEAVEVAKAIEKMSHGGQILTTVETWRTVSGMAEQLLGSPQVMDCGEHLLWDPKKSDLAKKKSSSKKVLSKRIVQLVPNSLSYDFFAARGGQEVKEGETPQKVCGRVFPPLLSHGQLSTSFLNAPYIGNKVAMVFVYTDKMEAIADKERKKNYKILAKYVRSHLMRLSPPGYECQEDKGSWMLAFDRIDNGINFGLDLKENVMKNAKLLGEVDKSKVFRVGIHWGPFLSMGPHTVTGHADYFGPIVNRAARVAAQCEAGQICVGVPMGTDEEPPDPGPTVEVDVLGVKQLKGISIEMAIFGCRKKEKEDESKEESNQEK